MRNLYCSDIDGTLNRQGYYLADDTRDLVHKIVEHDVWFTICTGRFLSRTLPVVEALNLKIPAFCLSGALAYDSAAKKILKVWPIDHDIAVKVIDCFQELTHRCHATIYKPKENRCLLSFNQVKAPQPFPMDKVNEHGLLHDEIVEQADLRPLLEEGQALLIDMAGDEEPMKKAYEMVKDLPKINVYLHESPHNKGLWVLDVVADNSGKGAAIQWLKEYMKADVSYGFGDHFNDMPMLKAADVGVTVAEAPQELKDAVDVVLPQTANCVPEFIMEKENIQ